MRQLNVLRETIVLGLVTLTKHYIYTNLSIPLFMLLTFFWTMTPFYTPSKQKTSGFLMFPRGIEREHWSDMD